VKEAEAKKSLEEKIEGEDEVRLFPEFHAWFFLASLQNTSRSHNVFGRCGQVGDYLLISHLCFSGMIPDSKLCGVATPWQSA
jgi:hypothetical protein